MLHIFKGTNIFSLNRGKDGWDYVDGPSPAEKWGHDGFEELMKMEAEEEKKYPSINRGHNQVYLEYWIDGDYIGSNVISYQKFPRPPPHGPFGNRSLPPQLESTRHFSQKPQ